MPHLSRVLRPASKRKPPIKRHGSSSNQQNTHTYIGAISRICDHSRPESQFGCKRRSGGIGGVIDKAKEHDYIQEFSRNPSLASNATKRHLQDLYLVEYCCRLVCAHENQPGSIDMVETLGYLNSTVLEDLSTIQFRTKMEFKTTFQLSQDPLLDYTLAIITKYWSQLLSENDSHSMQQGFSKERLAFASAASPFLKLLINRRLFPSAAPIWQDLIAASGPSLNSRKSVLEICFANDDPMSGMHWIWLWARRDQADWLYQWNQPDLRQWLFSRFSGSGRSDWLVDLFRLTSKVAGTPHSWIQDLLATKSSIASPTSLNETQTLEDLFHFLGKDAGIFSGKKGYYNLSSERRSDHVKSWFSGIHDPNIIIAQREHVAEQQLWREMVMIGALSRDISRNDVARSLNPSIIAAINTSNNPLPALQTINTPSCPDIYRDILTDYIDENATSWLNDVPTRSSKNSSLVHEDQATNEALVFLKRAIQEIMADNRHPQDALNNYRNLLYDIIQQSILRWNDLDLVSQTIESRFYTQYGHHMWSNIASAIKAEDESGGLLEDDLIKRNRLIIIPEINDFTSRYIQPMLAKICASRISIGSYPLTNWEGRLSDWVMAVTQVSLPTNSMARNLQFSSSLKSSTLAYKCTMQTLLESQQLDLAADLHSNAYNLSGSRELQNNVTQPRPSAEEVRMLVIKLAMSSEDPSHLERAQWIADQHIEREKALVMSGNRRDANNPIDIQVITGLVGAWSSRAQFARAHDVIRVMWDLEIQPNMIFYNTVLKSLMDLTPYPRPRRRTLGMGKKSEARERGRQIMVQQLLRNRELAKVKKLEGIKSARTILDDGWDMLQEVIIAASDNYSKKISLPVNGIDSPSMLKNLIAQSTNGSQPGVVIDPSDGRFRPDAYTFSILLQAFAQRGEIESIPGLFVDMKNLHLDPDAYICSTLANAFSKKGDLKALDRVVHEARVRNLDMGLYLANIVLDGLVEKNVPSFKIKEALDGMIAGEYRAEIQNVDEETEILVHSAGINSNSSESSLKLGNGIDAVTLTTLIKHHSRQNDIDASMDLLKLMVQAEHVPDIRVYILILSASIRKQDIAAGLEIIQLMRVYSKLFPDAKAWKGLLKCAMNLNIQGLGRKMQSSKDTNSMLSKSQSHHNTGNGSSGTSTTSSIEQPVISVLRELSRVLDEIEAQASANGKNTRSVSKEYLYKILTSSWLSLPNEKNGDRSESLSNDGSIIINADVKGKNGLLRRLLNHILEPSSVSKKKKSGCKQVAKESEIEQRSEHAIWLIRLVESHGIELGQQWKRDVIIPRIQLMTQRDPGLIMKQLGRSKSYSRKEEQAEDSSK
ncbi:hypothetical protein BGZ76_004462 [Entomortierella beljakovae]|nr:hypothetical protein BGZ76_004462 [Entomortierella beljakovae]